MTRGFPFRPPVTAGVSHDGRHADVVDDDGDLVAECPTAAVAELVADLINAAHAAAPLPPHADPGMSEAAMGRLINDVLKGGEL